MCKEAVCKICRVQVSNDEVERTCVPTGLLMRCHTSQVLANNQARLQRLWNPKQTRGSPSPTTAVHMIPRHSSRATVCWVKAYCVGGGGRCPQDENRLVEAFWGPFWALWRTRSTDQYQVECASQ